MGKDRSMSGWTPESLDKKAQKDAGSNNYNPPWGWFPGPEPVGREARDRYDQAYDHHKNSDDD
jgi:hypothetical protein